MPSVMDSLSSMKEQAIPFHKTATSPAGGGELR